MGNLVNLCHLDITDVPLSKMPERMCNLKNLETLCQFVLGKNDCADLRELGGLHCLSGGLAIKNLQNVADVLKANLVLKDKEYLNKIAYHWSSSGSVGHSQKDRNILDALEPHTNMKDLRIEGYGGERFSKWTGHTSYVNLTTLEITNCNCCFLPPLGQLPALEELSVSYCHSVVAVGVEFFRENTSEIRPFRSLKSLKFMAMSAWQEWLFLEGQDGGCFPSLEKLCILDCPNLNIFFSDYFPSLKDLNIQDNNGIGWFLPENREMDTAFPSLEHLYIHTCPGLYPFLLGNFHSSMKGLHLLGVDDNPPHTSTASSLIVSIWGCKNVVTFPELHLPATLIFIRIVCLDNLKALNFECCQHLTSLEKLEVKFCGELRDFPGEMLPTSLTSLRLDGIPNLRDLGKGLRHLTLLNKLEILNCKRLQQFPEGGELPTQLTCISISHLPNWKYLCKRVQDLICVENLDISYCENLQQLAGEDHRMGFKHLSSLKKLSIQICEKLLWLLHDGLPTTLTNLRIFGFSNLEDLTPMELQRLVCLERLEIGCCDNLRSFAEERLPASLLSLWIYGCPLLEWRYIRNTDIRI